MEQIAGLAWVTGLPDDPPVTPRGACDPLAGVHAAFAVLAALNFAERTGVGQQVELPMIETVLNVTAIQPIEYEVFGITLSRRGNRGHGRVIQNLYRCAGPDDEWIAVTVRTDQQWRALVDLMDRPSWCDGMATWKTSPGGTNGPTRSIGGCRTGSRHSLGTRRSNGWPARAFPPRRWYRRRWSPRIRNCAIEASSRNSTTAEPEPASIPARHSPGWPASVAGCTGHRRPSASTMKRCCAIGAG